MIDSYRRRLALLVAFVNGVVRSIGYTGFLTLIYSDVAGEDMAHATTLAATVQQVATGFAASAGVVALRVGRSFTHTSALNSQSAYRVAFVLLAALGLAAAISAFVMHPSAGDALRRVRRAND